MKKCKYGEFILDTGEGGGGGGAGMGGKSDKVLAVKTLTHP